jgi:transcriptional regulator with XRE-family HTH domain
VSELNFAQQLHQQRKAKKLSLREVSRLSGIATSTISRIENGLYSPTLDNAVKLAAAIGMKVPFPSQNAEAIALALSSEPDVKSSGNPPATVVEYRNIRITVLKPGIRRNLSKIAVRNGYVCMVLLRGLIQIRTNDGFRENLRPGATINCKSITQHTYFAVAAEEAEVLWIGPEL